MKNKTLLKLVGFASLYRASLIVTGAKLITENQRADYNRVNRHSLLSKLAICNTSLSHTSLSWMARHQAGFDWNPLISLFDHSSSNRANSFSSLLCGIGIIDGYKSLFRKRSFSQNYWENVNTRWNVETTARDQKLNFPTKTGTWE